MSRVSEKEVEAGGFRQYRRKQIAELRPWTPDFDMSAVSVSVEDANAGSPKHGDMIARNPKNHADQWLVAAAYFADNFEPLEAAALSAALAPVEAVPVVKAAELAAMYLATGFIECPKCGHEVETKHTDAEYTLREALAHPPAQAGAVTEAMNQLALIHSLANDITEHNYADKRLYILQTCVRLCDTLTAALGAQTPPEGAVTEAQGWRSIETAPKDGSIIILTNGREVFAGAWAARIKGDGFPWLLVEDVSTHQPHGCCDMEDDERIEVNGWPATAPTHWMPLPTPPVNQSEGADRG